MRQLLSELPKIAAGLGLLVLLTSCGSSKSISGNVVDAQTGEPIGEAQVQIKSYSGADMYSSVAVGEVISKEADGQGKFSFEPTKGYSWTICAWKVGYYPEAIGKAEFKGSVPLTKAKRAENADVEAMNRWLAGAKYRSGEGPSS